MQTAAEVLADNAARDERSVHAYMTRFTQRWTDGLDRNDAAQFAADLLLLVQAIHRDASRETHALLAKSLAAMPPPQVVIEKR